MHRIPDYPDPMDDPKPYLRIKPQLMRGCCHPDQCAGPSLTFRAVGVGLLVGSLLCFSNMYFGLQTGWVTMGSLQVREIALRWFVILVH